MAAYRGVSEKAMRDVFKAFASVSMRILNTPVGNTADCF